MAKAGPFRPDWTCGIFNRRFDILFVSAAKRFPLKFQNMPDKRDIALRCVFASEMEIVAATCEGRTTRRRTVRSEINVIPQISLNRLFNKQFARSILQLSLNTLKPITQIRQSIIFGLKIRAALIVSTTVYC